MGREKNKTRILALFYFELIICIILDSSIIFSDNNVQYPVYNIHDSAFKG